LTYRRSFPRPLSLDLFSLILLLLSGPSHILSQQLRRGTPNDVLRFPPQSLLRVHFLRPVSTKRIPFSHRPDVFLLPPACTTRPSFPPTSDPELSPTEFFPPIFSHSSFPASCPTIPVFFAGREDYTSFSLLSRSVVIVGFPVPLLLQYGALLPPPHFAKYIVPSRRIGEDSCLFLASPP